MDMDMKQHLDQNAKAMRNQVLVQLTGQALQGLLASHPPGDEIDVSEIAKDAVAVAKATTRELIMQRCL